MSTLQRAILFFSLLILVGMFLSVPVDYGRGFDWAWHNPSPNLGRELRNLMFWVLGTILLLFISIPRASRR